MSADEPAAEGPGGGGEDQPEVRLVERSVYLACAGCGAMVWPQDRERHQRFHRAIARALRGRSS